MTPVANISPAGLSVIPEPTLTSPFTPSVGVEGSPPIPILSLPSPSWIMSPNIFNVPVLFSIKVFVESWYRKQSLSFPRTIRSSVVPPVLSPNISLPPLILKVTLFCNDTPELLTLNLATPKVLKSIVSAAEKWTNVSVSPSCN